MHRLFLQVALLSRLAGEPPAPADSAAQPTAPEEPAGETAILPDQAENAAYFKGTRACYGFRLRHDGDSEWRFSVLSEDGTSLERQTVVTDPAAEEPLWQECGPEARRFAEVSLATCRRGAALAALLADPALARYRPPRLPPEVSASRAPVYRHFFSWGEEIGCARVVNSGDGRLRAWIPAFETLNEEDGSSARGLAYLQLLREDGSVKVHLIDRSSPLHLDTVVDSLEPLPGGSNRYLVLGLRSYLAIHPGRLPRRYAMVIEVRDSGPVLVPGVFASGKRRRDLLLLAAPGPASGKFRQHPLAFHDLEYVPSDGTIRIGDFGFEATGLPQLGYPPPYPSNRVVARWKGGRFRIEGNRWGRLTLSDRWGSP